MALLVSPTPRDRHPSNNAADDAPPTLDSYDSCDVGTFPNQTEPDGSGPAAALHSDASRDKYNFELSWLPGQRLSACTCPNEDHPGPSNSVGRGVPEIDILEAEKNKAEGGVGQVVSQSAQFAPFTHDYLYLNDTQDEWWIYDDTITRPNTYKCVSFALSPPPFSVCSRRNVS